MARARILRKAKKKLGKKLWLYSADNYGSRIKEAVDF
jgi:hypothetical protein